jgi:hypothetical protein
VKDAVYCLRSMAHFGSIISEVLGARLYVETPVGNVDRVFIVGMYDMPTYSKTLADTSRAKHRHIHWCGTDVQLLTHPELLPEATHSCSGDNLKSELFEKAGIDAVVLWEPSRPYAVNPFPSVKRVGIYLGSEPRKYGVSTLRAVVEAMKDHEFFIYRHGDFEDMQQGIDACRAYLRLTRHDGGAMSAREYMAAGRRAVITADLPHAIRVPSDDLVKIVTAIRKATSYDEPDYEAAAFYSAANSPEAFLEAVSEVWPQ